MFRSEPFKWDNIKRSWGFEKRRISKRYNVFGDIFLTFKASSKISNATFKGRLLNISKGGLLFTSNVYLPDIVKIGDSLEVIIQDVIFDIEVKYIDAHNNNCGCQFLNRNK